MHKAFLALAAASLLALGAVGASAQTIDFESLAPATMWQNPANPPGSVVFTQDNIDMSVEQFFFFPFGSGDTFNVAAIVPAGDQFSPNGSQALHTNNINVRFDLSALPEPAVLVSIEYVDLGGNENFQLNGEPLQSVSDLGAVTVPPGYTVTVSPTTILVESTPANPITSLLIGGQEFGIDNVTVRTREEPPLPEESYVYSVKFVCGSADVDPRERPIVEPGFYATEINIHNYRPEDVEIRKEFLILVEDGEAIGREPESVGVRGTDAIALAPNTATMDDCVRVAEITGVDTSILTIGYLVLRSTQAINVDAVYTTTGFEAGRFPPRIEVENVEGDKL